MACWLSGIRCSSAFALKEMMKSFCKGRQQHPGVRAWSLKGFKQGQAMPKVSVGKNSIGTQAWITARTKPEALTCLQVPAAGLCI